jgi:cyanophycin synthetase
MKPLRVLLLKGPNIWRTGPVLEAWIDCHALAQSATLAPAEMMDRLFPHMTDLPEMTDGDKAGWLATILAHAVASETLDLQRLTGEEVESFLQVRGTGEPGVFQTAVACCNGDVAEAALEEALAAIKAAIRGETFERAQAVLRLWKVAAETGAAKNTEALVAAAHQRGVPTFWLDDHSLVQLGHGARQKRIHGARTERTSTVAEALSANTRRARRLLYNCGIMVADADEVAGLPRYQALVIGRQIYAVVAVHLTPSAQEGAAPAPASQAQPSLPPVTDVTELIAPEVNARLVEAASILGLEVAGIEYAAAELNRPFARNEGILSVTTDPDLSLFATKSLRGGRDGAQAILNHLFPSPRESRVPIVAITGVNGKTTTTRMVAHIVANWGRRVGMCCTDGIYIGGGRIEAGDCSGPRSARAILMNPAVEAAVLETARGGILREGLGYDRADVAIVTNIGEGDHLGLGGVDTLDQLARVKRVLVENVASDGTAVLKADDPLTAAMAPDCPGNVVFFCRDANDPVIARHRSNRGRAVFVRDRSIVLADGANEIPLLSLDRVPLTHGGRIGFQVENTLAATAATWALGVPAEVIRTGMESFSPTMEKVPGRFNVVQVGGATVIFDYGHNTSSLAAMLEALDQFPHARRTCIYSAAGDRRDEDMVRQGELLGAAFDRVIVYEDHYLRGREPGQIIALFRQGIEKGPRTKVIEGHQGWNNAIEAALTALEPGELLVCQADVIDDTVEYVRRRLLGQAANREVNVAQAISGGSAPAQAPVAAAAK